VRGGATPGLHKELSRKREFLANGRRPTAVSRQWRTCFAPASKAMQLQVISGDIIIGFKILEDNLYYFPKRR
jgi:hypothetical protein